MSCTQFIDQNGTFIFNTVFVCPEEPECIFYLVNEKDVNAKSNCFYSKVIQSVKSVIVYTIYTEKNKIYEDSGTEMTSEHMEIGIEYGSDLPMVLILKYPTEKDNIIGYRIHVMMN